MLWKSLMLSPSCAGLVGGILAKPVLGSVIAAGIEVVPIPGCVAAINGLIVSGLSTGRFTFEGFLSANKKERRQQLDDLADEKRTMVFYEAPHKLTQTLKDMYSVFGNREVAVVKEITKLHETVIRTNLCDASTMYDNEKPKGEFVIIVEGKTQEEKEISFERAVEQARALVDEGMSINSASKQIASLTSYKKNDIYKALL